MNKISQITNESIYFKTFVTLYITNIPFGTSIVELKNLFQLYGKVESISMKLTENDTVAYLHLFANYKGLKQCKYQILIIIVCNILVFFKFLQV